MRKIKKLVDQIDEEVKGAKCYAEKYVEYKASGNSNYATRYKEMANDELKHATYLHDITVATIEEINKVYEAPEEMEEKWEKAHNKYVDRVAWIRQMLAM